MDEAEWLESTDPAAMLDFVTRRPQQPAATNRRRISDRKNRLFACACCRQVWHLLTDPRSRNAVEVAERFADGKATTQELDAACEGAEVALGNSPREVIDAAFMAAWVADRNVQKAVAYITQRKKRTERIVKTAIADNAKANILRDIVGNPFRPVVLPPGPKCPVCKGSGRVRPQGWDDGRGGRDEDAWAECNDGRLTPGCGGAGRQPCPWLTPLVVSLAQAAYDERNADGTLQGERLLVLSDALEDAGCPTHMECPTCVERPGFRRMYPRDQLPGSPPVYGTCWYCGDRVSWNAFKEGYRRGDPSSKGSGKRPNPILAHLRSPAPHVRGCWAVDLLLGKE